MTSARQLVNFAQFCERPVNVAVVACCPRSFASREIAESSRAYSRVSEAPLGTGLIESEPTLLGLSAHLLVIANRPAD